MIRVEHLSKSFGALEVLKDVSAEIRKGEVVSIIGPSGVSSIGTMPSGWRARCAGDFRSSGSRKMAS